MACNERILQASKFHEHLIFEHLLAIVFEKYSFLKFINIKTGPSDFIIFKGIDKICCVDNRASRSINKDSIFLHEIELSIANQMLSASIKRTVKGNDITALVKLVKADVLDAQTGLTIHLRIV